MVGCNVAVVDVATNTEALAHQTTLSDIIAEGVSNYRGQGNVKSERS